MFKLDDNSHIWCLHLFWYSTQSGLRLLQNYQQVNTFIKEVQTSKVIHITTLSILTPTQTGSRLKIYSLWLSVMLFLFRNLRRIAII